MADHVDDNLLDGDIFIYWGGRAPQHITHVLIHESVDEIENNAFRDCIQLLQVDTHNGLRRIGKRALYRCKSLRRINLKSAVEIGEEAFYHCENLECVEFGDRLETIEDGAFYGCTSLKHLKLPSIITIERAAFIDCKSLADVELSERLETIGVRAFWRCEGLQRIAVPLKRDLFSFDNVWSSYNQFHVCKQLTTVDLVGGIHKTVASFNMECWRTETNAEINRINQVLPNTHANDKTGIIKRWMDSVIDKTDQYKAEHYRYVKEGVTLLELALWKAKLDEKEEYECVGEKEDNCEAEGRTKKAKVDVESARKDKRMICGADMVISNVLPFLQLE